MLRNLISIAIIRVKSTYYHGGLNSRKDKSNMSWMQDKAQVIVATNALEWELTKQM
jgi:ATP-dependent DNA helicase RecQ